MAIMEEAQQKALWPYEALQKLHQNDEHFQHTLRQNNEKFLETILQPQFVPVQIPLITPSAEQPKKKVEREKKAKKSRNSFVRFFKKFLYFKPKTLWGTQILIPIISTTIGIWVTAVVKQPKAEKPHHHKPRVEQVAATNTVASVNTAASGNTGIMTNITNEQVMNSLSMFYQLCLSSFDNQQEEQKMVCPTCNHIIQVSSSSLYPATVQCLACKKPFQKLSEQVTELVRE